MKFNLKLWSKVAEIIGSLGIIISLIFVAIQYKKNSLALETSTVNSVNTNIVNWYSFMGDDLLVSTVFSKFFNEPNILTPEERFQAIMKLHSLAFNLIKPSQTEGFSFTQTRTIQIPSNSWL